MKYIIVIITGIIFLSGWFYFQQKVGVEVGYKAPVFELSNLNGELVALSDYEGKRVVIYFWVSWCPSCQTGLGYMNDFHNSYSGDEIEIISINLTNQERTPTEVMEFVKDEGLVFPVLLDETGQVAKDYQLYGTPTIYIINERGIIEERIVGLLHKEPLERLLLGKN